MTLRIEKMADLAEISSGFQFRGAIKTDPHGDVLTVQMSNVRADSPIPWADLSSVFLPKGSRPRFLQDGDVLFSARGLSNFAVVCNETPMDKPAVASQHFFLVRLSTDEVLPDFIAWQINQKPIQSKLSIISDGGTQKAIPLKELKDITVVVPPLEYQRQVVALHGHMVREKAALEALILNRAQMMAAVAQDLHSQATFGGEDK